MKKIFEMRKHRNRDRELDERYEENLRDYDDYEDYPEDDEFYEDDEYSDEDYAEDDEYYQDVDGDYPEDEEENPEEDGDYSEDEEENSDEDGVYPEDDKDYPEDNENNSKGSTDIKEEPSKVIEFARAVDREEYYEDEYSDDYYAEDEEDYPEDEDDYPEDEGDYPEDEEDYLEDEEDYPEDEEDYLEDEEDYPEDEEDYLEDEEDYPEDEEDYPEDEEDYSRDDYRNDRISRRDDRDRDGIGARILAFISNTTAVEKIAVGFALLIIVGGITTALFYMNSKKGTQQVASFTEIGTNLQGIDVIGQSGLLAVADAEKARAMAAELVVTDEFVEEEEEVEEVVADDAEDVTIQMTVTSIKSDLKVKFINSKTGKLVANLPREIDVINPDGSRVTYNDHDQDGIIYKKDLTAGEYKVTPRAL